MSLYKKCCKFKPFETCRMKIFVRSAVAALLLVVSNVNAQEIRYCGQTEQTEAIFNRFPHLRHEADVLEQQLQEEEAQMKAERSGWGDDDIIYIPLVFHIIHNGGVENISDEQIYSAVEILNRDFRLQNNDVSQVNPEFADLPADIGIEFRLAKRDPNGECTKGIVRVQSPLTDEGGAQMKALSTWPRNRYLNIWVCAGAGGAAGYTFLPSTVNSGFMAAQDGIVLLHSYTGNIGTSNNFRSRALTHEVGHWINLRHTWGNGNTPGVDSNCEQDDNVDDTPNTIGWTSCNVNGESCGTLDNVQNYMEYSYCSRMFTHGQGDRMRAAALSSVAQRNQLSTANNHAFTGIFEEGDLCRADFYSNEEIVCLGTEVQFFDDSYHGVTEWEWEFGDGQTISGSDPELHRDPIVVFDTPGVFSVTLTVSNGSESIQEVKESFIKVLPAEGLPNPFFDGFEDGLNTDKWFVNNEMGNVTWELTGVAAYDGERSMRLRNINNSIEGSVDELISSTLDLSNASHATISYNWAYVNRMVETDDRMRVSVSSDCGETWALRKLHRGFTDLPTAEPQNSPFVPSSQSQWGFNSVNVTNENQLVENFRFMFSFEGRGGNNVYLDNINIQVFEEESVNVYNLSAGHTFNLYPNPMNENAVLQFDLGAEDRVRITLHDALGREVRLLEERHLPQGEHRLDINRNGLATGIYVVRIQVGSSVTPLRLMIQ